MKKFNVKFFFSIHFTMTLGLLLGLGLGFLMDYFHGRNLGAVLLDMELSDSQNYTALAALFCVLFLFVKNRQKIATAVGLFFLHAFTGFTSLLMAFVLYCIMPSNIRNASFRFGMTTLLRESPADADVLRKLLIEKKPDPAESLPYLSFDPRIEQSWQSKIHPMMIVFSTHSNVLIMHGHSRYMIAIFLDSVDEATAKKMTVDDVYRVFSFTGRPLFSTRASGLTLVWEDITY
ncbi:MAG: hypothetical protein JWR15_1395 [Prosthecobacter sp.]|nr:hypothetical protein [Prosthecobacter sp.]